MSQYIVVANNMKIIFSILSIATIVFGHRRTHHTPRHHRKNPFANMPHQVVLHKSRFDLEKYKPPKELHIMDKEMQKIKEIEEKEHEELKAEESAIKKVESDYLASDLHKEAMETRFYNVPMEV